MGGGINLYFSITLSNIAVHLTSKEHSIPICNGYK